MGNNAGASRAETDYKMSLFIWNNSKFLVSLLFDIIITLELSILIDTLQHCVGHYRLYIVHWLRGSRVHEMYPIVFGIVF